MRTIAISILFALVGCGVDIVEIAYCSSEQRPALARWAQECIRNASYAKEAVSVDDDTIEPENIVYQCRVSAERLLCPKVPHASRAIAPFRLWPCVKKPRPSWAEAVCNEVTP